ncbi:MAG: deoxynucleoside kinase [Bacteroidetes bacterium]|nr:deoxynucleoside kinase [Bacteroidota bacterium]
MNAKYIVIEGNIGSGKTSLATMLSQYYQCNLVLEEFADNSFLPRFYEHPERWAFPLEMSFLADRYHQMKKVFDHSRHHDFKVVSDYLLDKSYIFAKNNLAQNEWLLYENFFEIISQHMPKPDILVYLSNTAEGLLKNIKKRGRGYEQKIAAGYLENIDQGYRNFMAKHPELNILVIESQELDFVNEPQHFEEIRVSLEKSLVDNQKTLFPHI